MQGQKRLNLLSKYENKKKSKILNPSKFRQKFLKRRATKNFTSIATKSQTPSFWADTASV